MTLHEIAEAVAQEFNEQAESLGMVEGGFADQIERVCGLSTADMDVFAEVFAMHLRNVTLQTVGMLNPSVQTGEMTAARAFEALGLTMAVVGMSVGFEIGRRRALDSSLS